MKRLLFSLVVLAILSSCTTVKELQNIYETKNFFAIDFTKYTEAGFLITPEKYIGDYESVGIVRYEVYPGAIYKVVSTQLNPAYGNTKVEQKYIQVKKWEIKTISMQDAIEGLYKSCKEMKADALVNFDIKYDVVPYVGISNPVQINGYVISGFAIKRK